MTTDDLQYFRKVFDAGLVQSPFLEVGASKVDGTTANLCDVARERKTQEVIGVDLSEGVGVDFTLDFSLEPEVFQQKWGRGQVKTVAVFNVLEHTFDPNRILENALRLVMPGGSLVVLTPAVWPIHNYPYDFNRLMPDWYEEFARRNGLELVTDKFCWISAFGIEPVKALQEGSTHQFPTFLNSAKHSSPIRYWVSRVGHRLFNTFGRSHHFTHAAIGATFVRPNT